MTTTIEDYDAYFLVLDEVARLTVRFSESFRYNALLHEITSSVEHEVDKNIWWTLGSSDDIPLNDFLALVDTL